MSHYRSNLRDSEFMLFDVLGRDRLLGEAPYQGIDRETARAALAEIDRLAREQIADSFASGDREPPTFDPDTHTVTLPEPFKAGYRAWMDAEWWRLDIPPELGGERCPPSVRWAAAEAALGSNPALFMYASGPRFAAAIWQNGTEEQRRLAELMIERRWAATMVLTEPDAGSDVGAARAIARQLPDGTWAVEGVKRFITGGEHDLAENIIHLVLARPVGVDGVGGPGTKGLSLFLVPKYRFDPQTGELGERNGVFATGLEHKMGLKVSATCELTFGGNGTPAVGWLLGEVHEGIRQMFQIIEYARMLVGTKAIATLSSGYLNALEYAKSRVQGADLAEALDKTAPRVPITRHPDVRRSLLTQKAYAEGMRALILYTASVQDDVELAVLNGSTDADAVRLNNLLLPIVKGYGSERAWTLLGSESLQTFGGSGFLQDYPLEQYVRDAKIDTLYEGTTAIQGLDLLFRKIIKDNGQALTLLSTEIGKLVGSDDGGAALADERRMLGQAVENVQQMLGVMIGWLPDDIHRAGQHTTRLLLALGDVVIAWLLLRKAVVALAKLDADDQADPADPAAHDYHLGVVATARWFCGQVLPLIAAQLEIVRLTDDTLMELPESAF